MIQALVIEKVNIPSSATKIQIYDCSSRIIVVSSALN